MSIPPSIPNQLTLATSASKTQKMTTWQTYKPLEIIEDQDTKSNTEKPSPTWTELPQRATDTTVLFATNFVT